MAAVQAPCHKGDRGGDGALQRALQQSLIESTGHPLEEGDTASSGQESSPGGAAGYGARVAQHATDYIGGEWLARCMPTLVVTQTRVRCPHRCP